MQNENEIKEYIFSLTGVSVNENTAFFDDLGIDGLDALIFMQTLSKKYDLDLSAYDPYKYHDDEGNMLNIFRFFYDYIFKRKKTIRYSFTFKHLLNVIEKKKWVDELLE